MTKIADNDRREDYTASAAQTIFPYSFTILAKTDLDVYIDNVLKAEGTDYTVSGVKVEGGGNVTLIVPAAGGESVIINGDRPPARTTDFLTSQQVLLGQELNDELSNLAIVQQQQQRDIGRCLRAPVGDVNPDFELPLKAARLGKFLRFASGSGDPEMSEILVSGIVLSRSVIADYLNPDSAAETSTSNIPTDRGWFYGDIRRQGALTSSSDNTAQIQAAINTGEDVYIPFGTWKFASQLVNANAVPMYGPGELLFTGSAEHAIVIGKKTAGTAAIWPLHSGLRLRRNTIVWEAGTDAGFAGIQFINLTGLIAVITVQGFDLGVLATAWDAGFTHNRITYLRAIDNRVDWRWHNTGAASNPAVDTGFCNENRIFGPNSQVTSGRAVATNMHVFEYLKESTSVFNGNICQGYSCEKANAGAGFSSVIHCEGTADSQGNIAAQETHLFRFEGPDWVLSGKGFTGNDVGMTSTTLSPNTDNDILKGTTVHDELLLALNRFHYPKEKATVQGSPVLIGALSRANFTETGTDIQAPARGAFWAAGGADFFNVAPGTLQADYFTLSGVRGVGILFDLRSVGSDYLQTLEIKPVVEATGGRIFCVCFDSSFSKLTDASNNLGHCSLGTYNVGNGWWQSGAELTAQNARTRISFGDDVAYAFIGVAKGTGNAVMRNVDFMRTSSSDIMPRYDQELMDNLSTASVVIPMADDGMPTSFGTIPDVPGAGDVTPKFVRNTDPAEFGSVSSKYIIAGWHFDETAWFEARTLTGN